MSKILSYIFAISLLLVPQVVFANSNYQQIISTGVTNVALTSAPTTSAMQVYGFERITLQVNYTHVSATSISLACQGSLDGINFGAIQAVQLTGGTGALNDYIYTKAVTGNTNFVVNLSVNYKAFRCTLTGAGAGAGDLVTVLAIAESPVP